MYEFRIKSVLLCKCSIPGYIFFGNRISGFLINFHLQIFVYLYLYFYFSHQSRDRLADLVAEHLDHLHYLNDILCINIDALNEVLTDQFLNRLLIPLYVYCLTMRKKHGGIMVGVLLYTTKPVLYDLPKEH